MVVDGRIATTNVDEPGVKTVEGVGVGDTETDVQRIYGDRIRVEPHPYDPKGHNLVYTPEDAAQKRYSTIFETDGNRVRIYRAGEASAVAAIEGCA